MNVIFLRGDTVEELKVTLKAFKSKVCDYILKDRECDALFITIDTNRKLYFKRDNNL